MSYDDDKGSTEGDAYGVTPNKMKTRGDAPVRMNRTPGSGPVAEALADLDDQLAHLEKMLEEHFNKIRPVLGPDMADDEESKDPGVPDCSDVRLSILTKIEHVAMIRRRLGRMTERVEL